MGGKSILGRRRGRRRRPGGRGRARKRRHPARGKNRNNNKEYETDGSVLDPYNVVAAVMVTVISPSRNGSDSGPHDLLVDRRPCTRGGRVWHGGGCAAANFHRS